MNLHLTRLNENYHLESTNANGMKWSIDTGEGAQGPSPMELLLSSIAGCSSIDVISILKKQRQIITKFEVDITGERIPVDEAKPFKSVQIVFLLEGEIDPNKALRAAQLSFEKYCSVSKTIENVDIQYSVKINGEFIK